MRRNEVCPAVRDLVVLDYDEPSEEGAEARGVEARVQERAVPLLEGSVCGLEDEDGLRDEEEAGGVEELRG